MNGNQRWLGGRDSYVVPASVIRTAEYEVAEFASDATAKGFVLEHHYSGTYPSARWRFGLYRLGQLVGVAVFSHPCSNRVLTNVFGEHPAVELGRFVLLDEVPGNGETWFLARCFELLRERVRGVVSFSDPVARATQDGLEVHPGHIGTIYQAHNARYLGRATPRSLKLLPDGRVYSARAIQKVRKQEKGWQHCVEVLRSYGAPAYDGDGWVQRALAQVTRGLRHPGNHRYAWMLDRRLRRRFTASQPYPKMVAA